jgi:hypothetical protein
MNLYNITNKVSLIVNEFSGQLAIREFRLHGVEVTHSAIGLLNPNTIRLKLNTVNSVIVTLTNIILQNFVVDLPRQLGGIFDLSALHLEFFDGYIYAGATPTYTPQLPQPQNPNIHDPTMVHPDITVPYPRANGEKVTYQGNEFKFIWE